MIDRGWASFHQTGTSDHAPDGGVAASPDPQKDHLRQAPWPYRDLDVAAIRGDGWQPTPIRELIVKVHQRCNLACDYCYVYTQADQSWRARPKAMSREIWLAAAARLGRHARVHGLTTVRVVLHGGEPLLFGADRLGRLAADFEEALPSTCVATFCLQTNGVLLDDRMLAALRRQRMSVGVSIDGPAAHHDRHRIRRDGGGSFAAVRAAIDRLTRPENREIFAGLLCTVSDATDPVETYDLLAAFRPPVLDFLLPHANWQHPPSPIGQAETPYARWLIAAFDRWYEAGDGIRTRLFEDIIVGLCGGASRSEQVGLSPSGVLVVETDGAIEQVDSLKSAYEGAGATGLDVRHHELDQALLNPGVVARQIGLAALSPTCQGCPIVGVCGGGHYAHRFRPGHGFQNPSVYCLDMDRLIRHIRDRITVDLPKEVRLPTHAEATHA